MSAIDKKNLSTIIVNRLDSVLDDKKNIEGIYLKIILIELFKNKEILKYSIDYNNQDSINTYWNLIIEKFSEIFEGIDTFCIDIPTNFYSDNMIKLLHDNINKNTDIRLLGQYLEDFKSLERLNTFTSTNRNSDVVVSDENITTVTQIFTPTWVSKYMAENVLSFGKFNLSKEGNLNYDKITILDPCLGSGYLLLDILDTLINIYKKLGKKIDKKLINHIYQNQLYGLDIDKYAIIISKIIFLLKAEEYVKGYLDDNYSIPNFSVIEGMDSSSLRGSLIRINDKNDTSIVSTILKNKYDIVITNPPYMGRKVMPKELLRYLNENYLYGKSEIYAAFIERCLEFLKPQGRLAMITLHTWMFLKSFEDLRKYILNNYQIDSLLHLGKNTFNSLNAYNALASAFVIINEYQKENIKFIKLDHYETLNEKEEGFLDKNNYYFVSYNKLLNIPDASFIYWLDDIAFDHLVKTPKLGNFATIRQGLATGDNARFIRYWFEVDKDEISFDSSSIREFHNTNKKYALYNKGGDQTRWYTTSKTIIKFDHEHYDILAKVGNHLPSREYYFKKGITWSLFGFNTFNVRYKEIGYVFDVSGSSLFTEDKYLKYILAYLSSDVAFYFLSSIAPTVNFQVGNIRNLPFIFDTKYYQQIDELVDEAIQISQYFDAQEELSWNYQSNEILEMFDVNQSLQENINKYKAKQKLLYQRLDLIEERINLIFNDIYNMNPSSEKKIDRICDLDQIIAKKIVSYLVGVIFNRYKFKDYESNTTGYISINELDIKIKEFLSSYFNDLIYIQLEAMLGYSLKEYLIKYFGKEHIIMFQQLPIYWYLKKENEIFIGYYHTIPNLDKDRGIRYNYLKNNLMYKIK